MRSCIYFGVLLSTIFSVVSADVYLHFPPGSNNRVNEQTADRAQQTNAFDSQNNDKGGYNVPDATNTPFNTNASLQYYLVYSSTDLRKLIDNTLKERISS